MKSKVMFAGLVAGMFVLAGCTGQKLYSAQKTTPGGSEFAQNLFSGYVDLAEDEYAEGDYSDSDNFADRAITSGTQGAVQPEEITARSLPANHVGELTEARSKLVAALNQGSAEKDPAASADAQVMFDCWMQEQEENWQPEDIARCRDGFYAAYNKIAPEPAMVSKAKPQSVRFVVYFETGKADLDDAARTILDEARAAAAKLDKPAVTVDGNADTIGATDYNLKLSELRAQAVAKVLGSEGLGTLLTRANGETNPAIMTADEVNEPRNRRVEIIIEQ